MSDHKNDEKPDFAIRDMEHSEAPIDQVGGQHGDGERPAGGEQNPPLPDGGPTDGEHGTDNDPAVDED